MSRREPLRGVLNHFGVGLGLRLSSPLCGGSGEPSDAPSGSKVECPNCRRTVEVGPLPKKPRRRF